MGDPNEVVALIVCTSASTGPYKLMQISHKNINCSITIAFRGIGLAMLPLIWASSIVVLYNTLQTGTCRLVTNQPSSPDLLINITKKHKLSAFSSHPNFLATIANSGVKPQELDSIELIVTTGRPMSDQLNKTVKEFFRNALTINFYATTETFGVISHSIPGYKPDKFTRISEGYFVKVVDESGNNLGVDQVGQFYVTYNYDNRLLVSIQKEYLLT